ncbi:hypothetical protein [Citrobacter koseri]|uniref:hypothetical protein n=1 Tax=Citrobacter koseri TaxID=545 RepID=UPI0038929552
MQKYKVTPSVVLTTCNDETEVFLRKAVSNFNARIQYMIDYSYKDFERNFSNREYVEEIINKTVEQTKKDFYGDIRNKRFKIDEVYFDEIQANLRRVYIMFTNNW